MAASERQLRACVHCGFCTATCPTYVLDGDALDSPRGRIRLIQDMLESDAEPSAKTVLHLDRCLGCLACTTTCPSGVDYGHLIDHARAEIETRYRRPIGDRLLRALLIRVLPSPILFRLAVQLGKIAAPFARLAPTRLKPLLAMAETSATGALPPRGTMAPEGARRGRVALMPGCVQNVVAPEIHGATLRFLRRAGYEVIVPRAAGCCGAMPQHLGAKDSASAFAARNVAALMPEMDETDAILSNASGCSSVMKTYAHLLPDDPKAAAVAARVSDLAAWLLTVDWPALVAMPRLRVAIQTPCSLQHGQGISRALETLVARCGLEPVAIAEGHLCCGSAGTYSMLQPDIAGRLRERKRAAIARAAPDLAVTSNVGCLVHLNGDGREGVPFVHVIELVDWATGGPVPPALTERIAKG